MTPAMPSSPRVLFRLFAQQLHEDLQVVEEWRQSAAQIRLDSVTDRLPWSVCASTMGGRMWAVRVCQPFGKSEFRWLPSMLPHESKRSMCVFLSVSWTRPAPGFMKTL